MTGMTGLFSLLAACGGTTAPASGPPAGEAPAAATPVLQRLRGEAVVGKDGYGVTPCGSQRQRIVRFAPAAQDFIDRFMEPGGRLEFFFDGWASEQDGQLVVEAVERVHTEGLRCDRELEVAVFAARGNEPFWSLSLTATGWELQRPDAEPLRADAGATKAGESYVWESVAPASRVELTPGYCADGMADAATAWQARLTLGEEVLSGCAWRGAQALP